MDKVIQTALVKRRQKKDKNKKDGKKAAHNAVESRRKLKISQLVTQLSEMVDPEYRCGKETQVDVLQKVVTRIQELQKSNSRLQESNKDYCHDKDTEMERKLQKQLLHIMAEHVHLLFQYIQHSSSSGNHDDTSEDKETTHSGDVPSSSSGNERCGFGVADLLEPYDHHTESRPLGILRGVANTSVPDSSIESPPTYMYSSSYPRDQAPIDNRQITAWDHTPCHTPYHPYIMPAQHSYYPDVETHPLPHPPHYMHDRSNNVWRPYNDQQQHHVGGGAGGGMIPSSQTNNSSFLVEQLLEKLL